MAQLHETAARPERAFLVGVQPDGVDRPEAESLLRELKGLASSLGVEVAGELFANLRSRSAALMVGTGKADEIANAAKACEADSIIFDAPLAPKQQRNWEELSGLSVYDRAELIIRIFGSRALTAEAELQVELARLRYELPRLAHFGHALEQQKGGHYGTRGSGEKKIELDRRVIERRIDEIKVELEQVRVRRGVQRRRREKTAIPRAAIVGYTNAGKSSLLNAAAGSGVLAEDKLFATLDATTRRLELPGGGAILLTDTVGFVRNLPHGLVEAFKATLEEAALADLLVHVVDASDPEHERHAATTAEVLEEIGAQDVPEVLVLNKIDLVDAERLGEFRRKHPEAILVSTKTGLGLEALAARINELLRAGDSEREYLIPYAEHALVPLLHREAHVLSEVQDDEGTRIRCRVPEKLESKLEKFRVERERP